MPGAAAAQRGATEDIGVLTVTANIREERRDTSTYKETMTWENDDVKVDSTATETKELRLSFTAKVKIIRSGEGDGSFGVGASSDDDSPEGRPKVSGTFSHQDVSIVEQSNGEKSYQQKIAQGQVTENNKVSFGLDADPSIGGALQFDASGNARLECSGSRTSKLQDKIDGPWYFKTTDYKPCDDETERFDYQLNYAPSDGTKLVRKKNGWEVTYDKSNTKTEPYTPGGINPDGKTNRGNPAEAKAQTTTVTTISIHATLSSGPPEDLKLIVDADDYENWIPQGGPDEQRAGNDIAVRATLKTKDGKEPEQKPVKVVFELVGTSSEPGVSLNWPAKEKATKDLDLKFDKANNPQLAIDDPKGQRAVSQSGETVAGAYVSCYDWGAYATLKVSAEMPDGRIIVGHLKNDAGPSEILLPKRAGNSKIADAWKKSHKASNKTDDSDDDKQDGNRKDGDGFTLYEEYRGVMAMGEHKYLDPAKKDLIVEVEDKLGNSADGGLQLFQTASGINVVKVRYAGELSDERVVNVNQGYAHGGDQHGLRLIQHSFGADDSSIAQARVSGTEADQDVKKLKSPKDCPEIWITDQLGKLGAGIGPEGPAVVAASIAHEIAHGCGVQHHGDIDVAQGYAQRIIPDMTWEVYATDGSPITQRPFDLNQGKENKDVLIGAAQGKSSGNVDCIMVYNHYFQWSMPQGVRAKVYMAVPPDERPGKIFCRSKTGTAWNAPDHKPYPVFGDAAVGDCMSQFRLKDW